MQTEWTAPDAGVHHLGIGTVGRISLTLDGDTVFDGELVDEHDVLGAALFSPPQQTFPVSTTTGQRVAVDAVFTLPESQVIPFSAVLLGEETVVEDADAEIAAAVEAAREADVAVVVVGTNSAIESEGFDRENLDLPGHQDRLVSAVAAANPRTVVVVNSGSPVLMPWRNEVSAVLLGWFGGQEFGAAIADVLLGEQEPGGRLPTSWPARLEDVPVLSTTPVNGEVHYSEGIHVGYRAWLKQATDGGASPAYPFGHGLGYTSFELGAASAETAVTAGEGATVSVPVTNTGSRTGREVVQVYVTRNDSAVDRPVRWLAGFGSVVLDAGSSATVDIEVPARAFAHYENGWQYEPGAFQVLVGRSVEDDFQEFTVTVGS
jgi:beta-glucosidase